MVALKQGGRSMKKFNVFIALLLVIGLLAACGGNNDAPDLTLEQFVEAFEEAGATDKDEPFYQMIGAVDGVMYYDFNDEAISIYEYESVKALEDAQKDNELIEDWETNGKFLLEAESDEAIEVFNNVE